jgi:hypothetical protein
MREFQANFSQTLRSSISRNPDGFDIIAFCFSLRVADGCGRPNFPGARHAGTAIE